MGANLMKFTIREIENTPYKFIDLEEHFNGLKDWPEEGENGLDFYNFELLLEEEKQILFAISNNYRADIYRLDLDTFDCHSLGSLGTKDSLEGDSLSIRAISTERIYFEYRISDDQGISGVYSAIDKEIIDSFHTISEDDYLYLTDRYYIVSKDPFDWDEEKKEWVVDIEKDRLYLYDRNEDRKYEIFDTRLKNTYHTSSNHFVYKYKKEEFLLNFPFTGDPEDLEELLKGAWDEEISKIPKDISIISLKEFVNNVKNKEEIQFKSIHSWDKTSHMSPYFYTHYTMESLEFSIYDLEKKGIKVFKPVFKYNKVNMKKIISADYEDFETSCNIKYIGNKVIVAYREGKTRILSPVKKTINHGSREMVIGFSEGVYLLSGWDEDKDGENHKEYLIFLDEKCEEILRIEEYFLNLENDLLIKI